MATQAGLAFSLYEADKTIGHEDFVKKFLEVFPGQSPKIAALYWQNKARRAKFGLSPVPLPEMYKDTESVSKAPKKTKEVPAKKLLKEVGVEPSFLKRKAKVEQTPEKTPDEIARIKEANLAKMKEVTQKMSKIRHAVDGPGVPNFNADEARREIEEFDDSFAVPKFLTKGMVKVLV